MLDCRRNFYPISFLFATGSITTASPLNYQYATEYVRCTIAILTLKLRVNKKYVKLTRRSIVSLVNYTDL